VSVSPGWVSDLALPGRFASRLAYGEHAAIERDGDDFVPPQRDAPVCIALFWRGTSRMVVSMRSKRLMLGQVRKA
jgi:hypothetical protein